MAAQLCNESIANQAQFQAITSASKLKKWKDNCKMALTNSTALSQHTQHDFRLKRYHCMQLGAVSGMVLLT